MRAGDRVLNYTIESTLGEGGMGTVYLGKHSALDQFVAIKSLSPILSRDEALRARFLQEANIQAKLRHPGIVQVLTADMESEQPSLVMEYIDGKSLSEVIEKRGALPVDDAIKIMEQVLSAVGYAHRQGVIHRDLKPSNVMVMASGEAKVTDFGIAKVLGSSKLTRTGTAMGSAHYMSPEQIRRPETVDARSDIYSLGCVFYEILTGRPPFGEKDASGTESDFEIKEGHVRGQIPALSSLRGDIPAWLAQLVMQLLEKEPEQRPPSCEVVLQQLKAAAEPPPVKPIDKTVLLTPEPVSVDEAEPMTGKSSEPLNKPDSEQTIKQPQGNGKRFIFVALILAAFVGFFALTDDQKEEPARAATSSQNDSQLSGNKNQPSGNRPSVWLTSKLYGHDNQYAAFRKVSIFEEGGRFKVLIANQFGFKCDLYFDAKGNPSRLGNCTSTTDPGWTASPSISMVCKESAKEQVCRGKYDLRSGDFVESYNMVIARRK